MVNALISIIVPVYNIEKYVDKCIQSIIDQTHTRMQIILVDDGSTDSSGHICDIYALKDQRIEVVHKKNEGLVSARKTGLLYAKGEYTGFVDGDDYIDPTFFEHLLEMMIKTSSDFVQGGLIEERENSKQEYTSSYIREIINRKASIIKKHVLYIDGHDGEFWHPSVCSKLFRTSFIHKNYSFIPDYQSYGEDLLVYCRCILESEKFTVLPSAEYHYVVRDGSISHQWEIKRFWQASNMCYELCKIWKEYGYYEQLKSHMDNYLFILMANCMNQINKFGLGLVKYVLPETEILQGKRVIVYGAGAVGKSYISQLLMLQHCSIVAWVDQKFQNTLPNIKVSPAELKNLDYDILILAVKDLVIADEIKKDLLEQGLEREKLVWIQPQLYLPVTFNI